mmetsp:Transcript_135479/g.191689  ORF Transcript_135479/g.191689 Transcript_135479/m.191689 type:complete len:171 (-) Transcript_135479:83-595(-)
MNAPPAYPSTAAGKPMAPYPNVHGAQGQYPATTMPQAAPVQTYPPAYPAQAYPAPQAAHPVSMGQPVHVQQYPGHPGVAVAAQPQQQVVVVRSGPERFGRYPQATTCTNCGQRGNTVVSYQVGGSTWGICCLIAICAPPLCPVAFCFKSTKDAVHHCPFCQAELGRKGAF